MLKDGEKTKDIINKDIIVKRIRLLLSIFFPLFIISCTTITPTTTVSTTQTPAVTTQATSWKERQAQLERIQSWRLSGKIAVRTPKDSGSASVNWAQNGSRYTISLMGPFGANGMKLSGQPGKVVLIAANGKQFSASSPEQLLFQQWGYRLPISDLTYWVRGLPAKGKPFNSQFDKRNRLVRLSQTGWNVQFLSYVSKGNIELPDKIFIYSPSLDTKIIIYNWQI